MSDENRPNILPGLDYEKAVTSLNDAKVLADVQSDGTMPFSVDQLHKRAEIYALLATIGSIRDVIKDDISSSQLIIMVDCSQSTSCRCGNYHRVDPSYHIGVTIWDIAAMLSRSFPESRVFGYSDERKFPVIVEVPRGERLLCPYCEEGKTLNGNTPEEAALEVMEDLLGDQSQGATGVVITDGEPQNPDKCAVVAKRMIAKGVKFCSVTVSLGRRRSNIDRGYYPQEVVAKVTDKEDLTSVVDTFNFLSSRH